MSRKGKTQMQTGNIEDLSFSKFRCSGCGMVFSIMKPKEICPECGLFFCESCAKNWKYSAHKFKHIGSAGGETPN